MEEDEYIPNLSDYDDDDELAPVTTTTRSVPTHDYLDNDDVRWLEAMERDILHRRAAAAQADAEEPIDSAAAYAPAQGPELFTLRIGPDVAVRNRREANVLLYGDETTESLYIRHFNPPWHNGKLARVLYDTRARSYELDPTAEDEANLAVLEAQLSQEGIVQLMSAIYQQEASTPYPGTDRLQMVKGISVRYESEGRIMPKALHFPSTFFTRARAGHRQLVEQRFPGMGDAASAAATAEILDRLVNEAAQELSGGSDKEAVFGEATVSRLLPRSFVAVILNPAYAVRAPTQVNGLTAKQQKAMDKMTDVGGVLLKNLDAKKNGYCMFETIAALSKGYITSDALIDHCGCPPPHTVTVEAFATMAAHAARTNFKFTGKPPQPVEFFQTLTAYPRTEDLAVVPLYEKDGDEATRMYRHVFHLPGGLKLKDVVPYETEMASMVLDLENIFNHECYGESYGLNTLPLRTAPTPVTSKLYDYRDPLYATEVLDVDTGVWHPMFVRVPDIPKMTKTGLPAYRWELGKGALAAPKIFLDGSLHVLNNLIPLLTRVKELCRARELHIMLVGFNSSRYDNYMLTEFLTEVKKLDAKQFKIGIYGNSILTMNLELHAEGLTMSTFDLRRHLAGSLAGNCANWGVPVEASKGHLDHQTIQMCYTMNPRETDVITGDGHCIPCFRNFIEANREVIVEYCKRDTLATAVLMTIYKSSMEFIVNKYLISAHGVSMGMIAAMSKIMKTRPRAATDDDQSALVRSALGTALARIGVSDSAMEVVRAIQFLRASGVAAADIRWPCEIGAFTVRTADRVTEPYLLALMERARGPGRQVTMQRLADLLWERVGGKLAGGKFLPNIDQYPTLASFATALFKLICKAEGLTQVGGFRYDITKSLRAHLCRAGRSQCKIGIFEDWPVWFMDIVSLYPAAMTCEMMLYALGAMIGDKKVVRCTHHKAYVEPEPAITGSKTIVDDGSDDFTARATELASSDQNWLIEGGAGTGKSWLANMIVKTLGRSKVEVTATTGIAACAVNGMTLDRYLHKHRVRATKKILLVDEISMCSGRQMERLIAHCRLQHIRLIIVGDVMQLPPVRVDDEGWFYEAEGYEEMRFNRVMLTKIRRTADADYASLCGRVRLGVPTEDDLVYLEEMSQPSRTPKMFIASTNEVVNELNQRAYDELAGDSRAYPARADDLPDVGMEEAQELAIQQAGVELKRGVRIIVTRNIYQGLEDTPAAANGSLGVVKRRHSDSVEVLLDDKRLVEVDYIQNEAEERAKGICYEYLPLRLAYALTVHKTQGMTIRVPVEYNCDRTFAPGMFYTAISRVSDPSLLTIVHGEGQSLAENIQASHRALEFVQRRVEERVEGKTVMRAGIWKAKIHEQPHGVVIPGRDATGYHWDADVDRNCYVLLTTPDVESLKMTGASFEILEGITFDDASNQLYQSYVSIFRDEKNRQDDLKKGKAVTLFDGEAYSPGIREACKLGMNILSGKEITKPFTKKRVLVHSEAEVLAVDAANEQQQLIYLREAREAMDHGEDLTSWRRKMNKAQRVPRLTEPPTQLGKRLFTAEWMEVPAAGKYSHINGYHIYGVARWIMTHIYQAIGYENFLVTETDSLAMNYYDIPKLLKLTSCFGDPLVAANGERELTLLPEAPACEKSKQFGQLECETTESLQKFFCKMNNWYKPSPIHALMTAGLTTMTAAEQKVWRHDNKDWRKNNYFMGGPGHPIKLISYGPAGEAPAGSYLWLNGEKTIYRGPFLAGGGKKIYLVYLLGDDGSRHVLKKRFKGLTFGVDWVVEPTLTAGGEWTEPEFFHELKYLTSTNRRKACKFTLTQMTDIPMEGVHRLRSSDIIDYIKRGRLYVVQNRVAESKIMMMRLQQGVVLKTLLIDNSRLTDKGKKEMFCLSEQVKAMSLLSMSRAISSAGGDVDSKCEDCDAEGEYVVELKAFCALHCPEGMAMTELCKHVNRFRQHDCGELADDDGYCAHHKGYRHIYDINIYCKHTERIDGVDTPCRELATPSALEKGLHLCQYHITDDTALDGVRCLREFTYRKFGSKQCQLGACEKALKAGYQLCSKHHADNTSKHVDRYASAKLTAQRKAELLGMMEASKVARLLAAGEPGVAVYCQQLVKGLKLCGQTIDRSTVPISSNFCSRHFKRAAYQAAHPEMVYANP